MKLFQHLVPALFGAWWLSTAIWVRAWPLIREEKRSGGSELKRSTRWFVWTTFIPFATTVILLMFELEQTPTIGGLPIWVPLWIGGGLFLMIFGDKLPFVGQRSQPIMRAMRKRSFAFPFTRANR